MLEMKPEIRDRVMSHDKPLVAAIYNTTYNQVNKNVSKKFHPGVFNISSQLFLIGSIRIYFQFKVGMVDPAI